MFVKEDLALYFGYGSERADIMAKNPHLNFDIAPVPQIRGNKTQVTFGRMQGIAIARNAKLVAEKDPEKDTNYRIGGIRAHRLLRCGGIWGEYFSCACTERPSFKK